jgi:hypothetical protein
MQSCQYTAPSGVHKIQDIIIPNVELTKKRGVGLQGGADASRPPTAPPKRRGRPRKNIAATALVVPPATTSGQTSQGLPCTDGLHRFQGMTPPVAAEKVQQP